MHKGRAGHQPVGTVVDIITRVKRGGTLDRIAKAATHH